MGLEDAVGKFVDINVKQPYNRISAAVDAEKPSGKGPMLVGKLLQEGATLPFRNAAAIMNWTGKKMLGVLGGTLKLGIQSASLIPLPIPGSMKNLADIRGLVTSYREALKLKAAGNPESFKTISDRIRNVRNAAQSNALAT